MIILIELFICRTYSKNQNCGAGQINLPSDISYIDDYQYYNCTNFTGPLVIPDTITQIGKYAFLDAVI